MQTWENNFHSLTGIINKSDIAVIWKIHLSFWDIHCPGSTEIGKHIFQVRDGNL
jgi:hypothetical protein